MILDLKTNYTYSNEYKELKVNLRLKNTNRNQIVSYINGESSIYLVINGKVIDIYKGPLDFTNQEEVNVFNYRESIKSGKDTNNFNVLVELFTSDKSNKLNKTSLRGVISL